MVRLISLLLFALPLSAFAQFPLSSEFTLVLDELGIRVNHPFDAGFKQLDAFDNPYLSEQLRLYSREEKLELRFATVSETTDDRYYQMPHLRAAHLVLNLASNDEDAETIVLSPDEEELATLNADWARVFIFRPKRSFSDRREAQLVASYRAGRGMLYTILLFDRAPDTLLGRQLALRWRN